MKYFPLFILAILSSVAAPLARAALDKPFELSCISEPVSTSFVVWTEGEDIVVRVIHHNGSDMAPAIVGTFTPNDLPTLAEYAAQVKKMGDDTTFRWPRAKCERIGEMGISCTGSQDVKNGKEGAKIKPWAIYTSTTVEDGIAGRFEWMSVGMIFDVNEKRDLSIEAKYPKDHCLPRRVL